MPDFTPFLPDCDTRPHNAWPVRRVRPAARLLGDRGGRNAPKRPDMQGCPEPNAHEPCAWALRISDTHAVCA